LENNLQLATRQKAEQSAAWRAEAEAEWEAELKACNGNIDLASSHIRRRLDAEDYAARAAVRDTAASAALAKAYDAAHPVEAAERYERQGLETELFFIDKKAKPLRDRLAELIKGKK
jgi:hypothetical protein